jgi:HEAT repeat protein
MIVLLFVLAIPACGQAASPTAKTREAHLIAVLKSNSGQKEKADACRDLAIVGTRDAVTPLAALLDDEQLSHMARYALETIPDSSVDAAFRDALLRLKGRPLVGVIGSMGVRRDEKAVVGLTRMLHEADSEVVQAAARALGRVGTSTAASILRGSWASTPAVNHPAFCEGLFRCAESLAAQGQRRQAIALYDYLRAVTPLSHPLRAGAVRGAIINRRNGLPLLREYLHSDDYTIFAAAIRTAQEMSGQEVTRALAAELDQLPADQQIVVIQTLGKRAEAAALPVLFAAVKPNSAKPVRLAAVRALPEIGDASAVPVLVGLMSDADQDIASTAQESLAEIPGREADAAVLLMLGNAETSKRLTAIDLIGRRRMTACLPQLLKTASDAEPQVHPSALKKVGELGGLAELPVLLELLTRATAPPDIVAAEQAITAICAKADEPESCVRQVTGWLDQARPAQKNALLRVLTTIGGASALKAIRASVADPNPEIRAAAIRALGDWKTSDAASDLLTLAQKAVNPAEKTLCLRSYLGLASNADLPADQRLGMCRQAAELIQRSEEKKLLLATLGGISSFDSLALIQPYLDDVAIQNEAATAAVAIADKLLRGPDAAKHASKLIEPLVKAARSSTDAALTQRARALLQQAQSKGAGK